jgi:hypothetical protein
MRKVKARVITEQGGRLKDNGHWCFKGEALANDTHKEFAQDYTHIVRDLPSTHPNNIVASHAYDFSHINRISDHLGIPWELSKDTLFSSTPTFIGFIWDLENNTVGLMAAK